MVVSKDWIEMPNIGADGDVLELTFTTLKVKILTKLLQLLLFIQ